MKHCPNCGAELISPDAAFCSECGRRLKRSKSSSGKHAKTPELSPKKRKPAKKRVPVTKPSREELPYDGCYDDVLPDDDGELRQGLDPKTVKNIVLILCGVLVIVILCVVALYLM